jgi:hypothetical protein
METIQRDKTTFFRRRQEMLNAQKYKCANYYLIFVACTSPLFAFTIILS